LTMAGARVQDHLANPALAAKLAEGFDVVVIQGQSVEPITDYPAFETAVVELAGQIGEARYLLFQTWPRQEGSPDLIELGMTVEEMAQGLESGYFEAALASGGELAPVGGAWMS
ncbi:MAG: hypothetical protein KC431_04485, partial [Myxococcales bacterium]|nr:hypothetical protein [Myxococcales bacterium]